MAAIRPFRALRPARDTAAAVSSVPYDVVNTEEARQLAAGNPLSFLHVTRSEIDLPPGTDPYSARGLREGEGSSSRRCATSAPLVVEDEPSLYFYRLRMGGHEQTGLAALLLGGRVRAGRHQEARAHAARQGRRSHAAHRRARRADGRRVPDLPGVARPIDRLCRAVTADAPLYDFRADDGVHHTIWRVTRRGGHRAGGRLRARARAVHCGRAPSRRERGARQGRDARARRCRRGGHVHRGRVSRRTRCTSFPTTAP